MPLMQQILLAIRTLTEDEPPQYHNIRHGRQRRDSKRQQAVNLVITFRELFSSGGFNFLNDEDAFNRSMNKSNHSQRRGSIRNTPSHDICDLEYKKQFLVDLPEEGKGLPVLGSKDTVSVLIEQRFISSTELAFPVTISSNLVPEVPDREFGKSKRNSDDGSYVGTKELVVFNRRSKGFNKKSRQPVTVPLSSDDENKTVAALRKVLKWSPTKQNLATFAVSVPKEEEHKAVAVVQNAVNRVKEEQQKKKKRKFKLFKLTFC